MISLDQVLLLEKKVESAVAKIQQLQAENDALRNKCAELTNALSSKSEQLSTFQTNQTQIESGILNALDRLDQIENSVLKVSGQASSANISSTVNNSSDSSNTSATVNKAEITSKTTVSAVSNNNFNTMQPVQKEISENAQVTSNSYIQNNSEVTYTQNTSFDNEINTESELENNIEQQPDIQTSQEPEGNDFTDGFTDGFDESENDNFENSDENQDNLGFDIF